MFSLPPTPERIQRARELATQGAIASASSLSLPAP